MSTLKAYAPRQKLHNRPNKRLQLVKPHVQGTDNNAHATKCSIGALDELKKVQARFEKTVRRCN